jgi:acyl-CoA reductase-like NAD-dependent aldehyde dehydrogenase
MTAILDELKERGKTGLYIGGDWFTGNGELPVVDPATEDVLVGVSLAEASHAAEAVDAAAAALGPWSATRRCGPVRRTWPS